MSRSCEISLLLGFTVADPHPRMDLNASILGTLNEQQRQAVQFDSAGALQVIAGPGTGKTKVLVARVAYLLLHEGMQPRNIIVTTFTNKAAKEMTDRLAQLLQGTHIRINDLIIGTFHSVCLRILSRFGSHIGLEGGWRIAEEKEVDAILTGIVNDLPDQIRDYATSFSRVINLCRPTRNGDGWAVHPQLVKREISKLKSSALLPEEYQQESTHDEALAFCYARYQAGLQQINVLDFDDLLMYTFRLLCKERCLPDVKHVFVDEFQDTNSIQMDLMFMLARGDHHLSRGITVVGDPDQSIYAFRNALAYNFQQMSTKCPIPCSQVVLVENYRSSQKILDTSETLIKQQQHGRQQRLPLRAQFDCEFPPVYTNFPVGFMQGPSIAREILYLKALPGLFSYNDFAILVRQRRQIKSIETALIEHRIPYNIIKGHAFWELKEITSMLNLLRCVYTDNPPNAIVQCLLYPARGIGQTSGTKIKQALEKSPNGMEVLQDIYEGKLQLNITSKGKSVIKEFIDMIKVCKELFKQPKTSALTDIFDTLYQMSGMEYEYLYQDGKDKKGKSGSGESESRDSEPNLENTRHKNIQILKNYFLEEKQMEELPEEKPKVTDNDSESVQEHIRIFFNSLSLYTQDSIADKAKNKISPNGAVTISTIHGSKGLEWPIVIIPGVVDGIIPCVFQSDNKDDDDSESETDDGTGKDNGKPAKGTKKGSSAEESLDEERRMFFVAQTRAKILLYMSSVAESNNPMHGGPSRFLTPEVLRTLVDEQRALASVQNIKDLYQSLNKDSALAEQNGFSFKTLVDDYTKFIEDRRESMFWAGKQVRNLAALDITRNNVSMSNPRAAFTTAAAAMKSPSFEKQYAPSYSPVRNNAKLELSPVKTFAPKSNIRRSPSPPRQFAPRAKVEESPTKPTRPLRLSNNIQIPPSYAPKAPPYTRESSNSKFLQDDNTQTRDRIGTQSSKNKGRIVAKPINLSAPAINLTSTKPKKPTATKMEDTTAAEILHDPTDLMVDNRPIIASAKTLADAIRQKNQKQKPKGKENKANGVSSQNSKGKVRKISGVSSQKPKSKTNKASNTSSQNSKDKPNKANQASSQKKNSAPASQRRGKTKKTNSESSQKATSTTSQRKRAKKESPSSEVTNVKRESPFTQSIAVKSEPSSSRGSNVTNEAEQKTTQPVKKESSSMQFDIFSQLSRAKKKSRINNDEIIIIDD